MYMHQFGWLSERGGSFFNLLQTEGVPRKEQGGEVPQKRGGSNLGENYVIDKSMVSKALEQSVKMDMVTSLLFIAFLMLPSSFNNNVAVE